MDVRTKHLIDQWLGITLNGWHLAEYVNCGKSALVFKGLKGGKLAAIKVFDPEIIEKFGKDAEEGRIKRELSLIGSKHQHLVEIFDGGYSEEHGIFFIVMEFIEAPNLAMVLSEVPTDKVSMIISQVASAAEFLEKKDIVHRDIKPDNIAVFTDFSRAILLDLGVIRPLKDAEPLTDREKQVFVGTLQYGSPEFVLREEEHTTDGFRSVTFYQLGAVLHDLLTRKRIFQEFVDPYPKLVQAVLSTKPLIDPSGKPPHLVRLAKNCLVKDPKIRREIVNWKDFYPPETNLDPAAAAKEQIRRRRAVAMYESASDEATAGWQKLHRMHQQLIQLLSRLAEQVRAECADGDLPPVIVHELLNQDGNSGLLRVFFKRWPNAGLLVGLTLVIKMTILEQEGEVIRLEAAAVSSNADVDLEMLAGHWFQVISGVYDDSLVRSAVAKILYPIVARAMDQPADLKSAAWMFPEEK